MPRRSSKKPPTGTPSQPVAKPAVQQQPPPPPPPQKKKQKQEQQQQPASPSLGRRVARRVCQAVGVVVVAAVLSALFGRRAVHAVNPEFAELLPALTVETDAAVLAAKLASAIRNHTGAFTPPDVSGLRARHPVVIVPGFVNTNLELWRGKPCAERYFRQRMWGTMTMVEVMLLRSACWAEHMSLDPETGLDPEGISLRPAMGLEAADYIVPGYWVWARLIQMLALVGYDNNDVYLAAYDWRLSFENNERRDRAFTRLRQAVEMMVELRGHKAVFVPHSMGAVWSLHFFNWVSQPENGGQQWIDKHVHAVANVGGALLGTPKALTALMSGEMKDTANLDQLSEFFVDKFFSKQQRRQMFRSWSSVLALLPKGGDAVWGNATAAPDDAEGANRTYGNAITFTNNQSTLTTQQAIDNILADPSLSKRNWVSFGSKAHKQGSCPRSSWGNPLECPLPYPPKVSVYCLYGTGKATERAYLYTPLAPNGTELNMSIINNTANEGNIHNGVHETDGDGTVPLMSLGYMCTRGWRRPELNPAGAKTFTREYKHDPTPGLDIRGGPKTADHVDILGNTDVLRDLIAIVAGQELEEKIHSNIREISARVDAALNHAA
eukprot:m51a1_g9344 putative phospholipid:diacylglycerol acyltransferase (608) ;mRNA; f:74168-76142